MAEIIDNLEQVIARIKKGAESIESANDVVLKVTEVINVLSTISDSLGVTLKHNESTSGTLLKDTAEMKESLLETVDQVTERLSSLNGLIKASDENRKKLDGDIASITQLIESNKIEILMAQDTLDGDLKKMLNASITGNTYFGSVLENLESLNTNLNIQSKKMTHLEGRLKTFSKMIITLLIVIAGGVYANFGI
jgi:ABC-type transporter Mla subunit MlaD